MLAKTLIAAGLFLILLGIAVWGLSHLSDKPLALGRLPGDILIERENFKFFFPLTSCALISMVASGIYALLQYLWSKK